MWERIKCLYGNNIVRIIIIGIFIYIIEHIVILTGGTKNGFVQMMYVPIILSAFYFGIRGAVIAATSAAMVCGPLMPIDISSGLMQGHTSWMLRLGIFNLVGIFSAATLKSIRLYKEKEIDRLNKNAITGLFNTGKLKLDLEELIGCETEFSLIGFKIVNADNISKIMGYDIGIKTIKKTAEMLQAHFKTDVYSIFLNEFALILPNSDMEEITSIGKEFLKCCAYTFEIDKFNIQLVIKGGIANYQHQLDTPDSLIRKMGMALSQKSDEIGLFVYDSEIENKIMKRQEIITALFNAIKNEEFYLVYQPKINLHNNNVDGAEALLRWNYALEKHIDIGEIVKIAEEIGVVSEITKFVMQKAAYQAKKWQQEEISIKIAINMSLKDLRDNLMVNYLVEIIKTNNLDPSIFEIELTESGILDNENNTLESIGILKKQGIKISLDDFGTGYNSLVELTKLPVDNIKIDKNFIDNVRKAPYKTLIEAIIYFSHKARKNVIAEGVEQQVQVDILRSLNCDYIQGYYFCKPIPPEEMKNYIDKNR